jgi:tetratricopeptide (TPR) repeat protein
MEYRLASVAFIAVIATYLFLGGMGDTGFGNQRPNDAAYNLLARGLMHGHLSLDKEAPPMLAQLGDPYDPSTNGAARDPRDRLNDLSYFHGKLYLYFGIAPALFVFIPWHLVTGGWLPHWTAVVLLCSFGLLVNLSLIQAIKQSVFPDSKPWLLAICTLVLGLGSYAPLLVARADMWEVPIAFSYLCVSVALRCLWVAYNDSDHPARWIAIASAAFGFAFAARPTVLPNAAILLIPFLSRETRGSVSAWMAAVLPVALCGLGVALYNAARFGNPFDFGMTYQLAGVYVARLHTFSPSYIGTNLGFYLFQGVRWSSIFPFTHEPALGPLMAKLPPNHGGVQQISGALFNAPILWAAVGVPLYLGFWRRDRRLLSIAASASWVALSSLGLLSFFYGACSRYQFEFVPAMALVASMGILAIDRVSVGTLGTVARCLLIPALLVSCAFPVLYGIERCTTDHNISGFTYLAYGDIPSAAREFDDAQFLSPRNPVSRLGSGTMLSLEGRRREAMAEFVALIHDFPDYAMAHLSLGSLLAQEGRTGAAIAQLKEAHSLDPQDAAIAAALAAALKDEK